MQVHVFPPRPSLERQVRELRVIETDVDVERVLVPEPALLLGVRTAGAAFDEHGRVPDETLTGLRRTARRMRTVAGSRLVLVVFRELGARAFFDVPLHELAERTVSLDTLIPVTALRRVRAAVRSTSERHAQVAAVQDFLEHQRREDSMVDRRVLRALAHLEQPIDVLAASVGLSRDRFEKRFRQAVGLSPRQYAALVRLRGALLQAPSAGDLGALAAEAGYFDQSHFIREVRAATGVPPRRLLDDAELC